jgi:hypothetical protein
MVRSDFPYRRASARAAVNAGRSVIRYDLGRMSPPRRCLRLTLARADVFPRGLAREQLGQSH